MAGFLSPTGTSEKTLAQQKAAQDTLHNAGKAYSNYRQFSRDNYANQLSNQSSIYQGMMNRLQSAYGGQGAPNVRQMGNSPMSLRQTTVGSTFGSNAAGWGAGDPGNPSGHMHVGDDNYGLIGQMGAVNPNDQLSGNPDRTAGVNRNVGALGGGQKATIDSQGQPLSPTGYAIQMPSAGGGNAPQSVPQSGTQPGQFSFAPRRP
jgi:hypothetical protein